MAGTVADLLDTMKMLNNELKVGAGEAQETVAIRALKHSQHMFENIAATRPYSLQSEVTTVQPTAGTEKTAWPTNLLRMDAIWLLDANGKQIRQLYDIDEPGGHTPSYPWPLTMFGLASGSPYAYYANQQNFYWLNLPDATYNTRIYGLVEQSEFAARANSVFYPARAHLALAQFAVKLLKVGVDDSNTELEKVASQIFIPLLKSLKLFKRVGPKGRVYSQVHTT